MKENCQYYDFNELNFTSVQGAIITLPYCFLNSEVQGVVKLHWNRFVPSSDCWKILKKLKKELKSFQDGYWFEVWELSTSQLL